MLLNNPSKYKLLFDDFKITIFPFSKTILPISLNSQAKSFKVKRRCRHWCYTYFRIHPAGDTKKQTKAINNGTLKTL